MMVVLKGRLVFYNNNNNNNNKLIIRVSPQQQALFDKQDKHIMKATA